VRIPPRDFSIDVTLGEFVDEACATLYTISDYLYIVALVLLVFVALVGLVAVDAARRQH
jgi:hypothetical protein